MKKVIVFILLGLLCLNVSAKDKEPKYKIIANSNNQSDIEEMYNLKNDLLINFKEWTKSVDDVNQALYDHKYIYNATYEDGIFLIKLGNAKGKELNGTLKINYCENTSEIKKRSFIFDFFF